MTWSLATCCVNTGGAAVPSTLSAALTFHCAQQSLLPSVHAGCIAATLLEVPARFAAGACAVIDLDLCRGVGGVGGRQAVRRRQGCRINGFARAGRVGQAAIVGALYIDVERGRVMVRNINRRCIARGVVPHAVVTGDQRGHHIGRGEKRVAAVSGVCRGEPGRRVSGLSAPDWKSRNC